MGERETHSSYENFEAFWGIEVWVREEGLASVFPSQSDDVMVENVEREAPSGVPLKFKWRKSYRRWKKFQAW